MTVVGVVDDQESLELEVAHAQDSAGPNQEVFTVYHHSADEFVSRQDFELLNNQLEEKFARFEALLTRANIFTTPKVPVSTVTAPVSDTPFFSPSDPRATDPVRPPGQDRDKSMEKPKEKKNNDTGKSEGKKAKTVPSSTGNTGSPVSDLPSTGTILAETLVLSPKVDVPGLEVKTSLGKAPTTATATTIDIVLLVPVMFHQTRTDFSDSEVLPGPSDKDSEEGEISDTETLEQNEEMNYRETVRPVRAFLGWTYIPDFEPSGGDVERSVNPWKGKHPRKAGQVSVELPADDWLCHKMEKLNTRAAEGYPSCSQESVGLKVDQFICTPQSQAKWYQQTRLKQDITPRPGKNIFSWSDAEAQLNAQFSRIAKVSSYPQSGPASRPVPQDILRWWEKCARVSTYVTNHAAGFNHYKSEIQEKMIQEKMATLTSCKKQL